MAFHVVLVVRCEDVPKASMRWVSRPRSGGGTRGQVAGIGKFDTIRRVAGAAMHAEPRATGAVVLPRGVACGVFIDDVGELVGLSVGAFAVFVFAHGMRRRRIEIVRMLEIGIVARVGREIENELRAARLGHAREQTRTLIVREDQRTAQRVGHALQDAVGGIGHRFGDAIARDNRLQLAERIVDFDQRVGEAEFPAYAHAAQRQLLQGQCHV